MQQHVKNCFEDDGFVVYLTKGIFNCVWLDYTLETTDNKELKGKGTPALPPTHQTLRVEVGEVSPFFQGAILRQLQ